MTAPARRRASFFNSGDASMRAEHGGQAQTGGSTPASETSTLPGSPHKAQIWRSNRDHREAQ